MLTPLIPLSNRIIVNTRILFCSREGENLRGGFAPSLNSLPFPAKYNIGLINATGWRGDKGVRLAHTNQMQTIPE
jgi:hypothetical protein